MQFAEWILFAFATYAVIGILFGFAFALKGAAALDPAAKRASWQFRAILFPGSVALWPILLKKWLS